MLPAWTDGLASSTGGVWCSAWTFARTSSGHGTWIQSKFRSSMSSRWFFRFSEGWSCRGSENAGTTSGAWTTCCKLQWQRKPIHWSCGFVQCYPMPGTIPGPLSNALMELGEISYLSAVTKAFPRSRLHPGRLERLPLSRKSYQRGYPKTPGALWV